MRNRIALLWALTLALGLTGFAQSKTTSAARGAEQSRAHRTSQLQTIQALANAVAIAWSEGKLRSLDPSRPYVGTVKVFVEPECGDDPQITRKSFRTLAQIDRWFKSQERADGPGKNIGTLEQCSKGVCTFQTAMNHNNLYLRQITYGMRRGKPYIKTIHIADGC